MLDPKSKSALLLEGPAPAVGDATDMAAQQVEGLRMLAEAKGEPVGRRRIGAVEAEGFRVWQRGQEVLVPAKGFGRISGDLLRYANGGRDRRSIARTDWATTCDRLTRVHRPSLERVGWLRAPLSPENAGRPMVVPCARRTTTRERR